MMPSDIHVALMITGFFVLFFGFFTARFMKKKRWWLKMHESLGVFGAFLTMLGFFIIVFHISLSGRPYFTQSHGYVGIMIALLAVIMPTLGFIQLKIRMVAGKIRPIHRFFGWIMLMAMFINIILGMYMAGIF
ncbi:MAG: hypothetical protein NT010_10425 [Proteobacteria bacterium]|nr:hypothetical protein [Pseudomonadota bacterium]